MSHIRPSVAKIGIDGLPIARPICYTCFRPSTHCFCSELKSFHAHTNLLILQHPNERKKYYSTAKFVLGSISNSRMLRGVEFDNEFLAKTLTGSNFYLLYPGADSIDCESMPLSSADTVIALDGTWSEAGKILFRNPILKTLPKISFSRELKSEYKIRKQPKEKYLSTLESIGHLLKLNAAVFGSDYSEGLIKKYDQLFKIFSFMVDKQISYFPRNIQIEFSDSSAKSIT